VGQEGGKGKERVRNREGRKGKGGNKEVIYPMLEGA